MKIKKILIFNPFGIGDVLFTTPLVKNLKDNLKDVSISYLCNRRTQPLLKNNKFIDEVMVFEKDEWRALAKSSRLRFAKDMFSFFNRIRKTRFDVVFDLSNNSQYGFFLKAAGIKMRIGYNFRNRGRFLTHRLDLTGGYKDKPVASYCLDLLGFLSLPVKDYNFDLFLDDNILQRSRQILKDNGINEQELILGVCPGSGDSWQKTAYFKRWPEDNFLALCEKLQKELAAKIILCGSKGESSICDYIAGKMQPGPVNLCGKINLEEFCAVLSLCGLVITNDGGPFHIAQALDKKAAVFFGPVDEKVYGIYPPNKKRIVLKYDIDCRPCYQAFKFSGCSIDRECLKKISVVEAFTAVKQLLEQA